MLWFDILMNGWMDFDRFHLTATVKQRGKENKDIYLIDDRSFIHSVSQHRILCLSENLSSSERLAVSKASEQLSKSASDEDS